MKKKLFMFLLLFTFSFSFVACSGDDDSSSKRQEENEDEDEDDEDDDKGDEKDKDDDDSKDDDKDKDNSKDDDKEVEPEETPELTPEPTPESTPEPTSEPDDNKTAIVMPTDLSVNLYDYQFSIDGQVYDLPMWFSDMEAIGWEYKGDKDYKLDGISYTYDEWEKGDLEIWTNVSNFSINANNVTDCQITTIEIDADYLDEPVDVLLPKRVQLGVSTYEDVIAAYGEPTNLYEGLYYTALYYVEDDDKSIELKIDEETGVLNYIELTYEIEMDGFDNTVNPNPPASLAEYIAPTELGADIFDTVFELEGVKYQFPVPITELLSNGFTYEVSDDAEMVVTAGNDALLYLLYGDVECYVTITNFEDTATYAQNCYVTAIDADFYSVYGSPLELTISGGIQCNVSTEEELLAALGEYEYDLYEYDDYKTYSIFDPKVYTQVAEYGYYTNGGNLEVRDGIVTRIRREYSKPINPIK